MPKTTYLGRRAVSIENEQLRLTVSVEGGHIAEVYSKKADVNPMWVPNWKTVEPSSVGPDDPVFGNNVESKLLAGILGHNLCLDLFGGPSEEEAALGMTAHGESSVLSYDIQEDGNTLTCTAHFPLAQIDFVRTLTLDNESIRVDERVTSTASFDRPIGWTHHVTLSPPFLDPATTEFRLSAAGPAMTHPVSLGEAPYLKPGEPFGWPNAPALDGGGVINVTDMKPTAPASSYVAVVMKPQAYWSAWSPKYRFAIAYVWDAVEFPWLGIWEENRSRSHSPWNNAGVTRGMEFGVSPFPESRHAMVERGETLNTPGFKWLPAKGTLTATYYIRTFVTNEPPVDVAAPAI
jgi:hypothetical protein